MKPSVSGRKLRIVELSSKGLSASEIVKIIAKEFDISERQAWREWGSRLEWMPSIVKMDKEAELLFYKLLDRFRLVIWNLFELYDETEDEKLKVKILRDIFNVSKQEFQMSLIVGIFPYRKIPKAK